MRVVFITDLQRTFVPQSLCCPSSRLTWFNTDDAVYLQTLSSLCVCMLS